MSPGFEAATALPALLAAARRAARGSRGAPAARFLMDAEPRCLELQRALRCPPGAPGAWQPSLARRFRIRDPKPREIAVVPFTDRVVHHALCAAAAPDFERYAIAHSYACRIGGGQHAALRQAQCFSRGAPWVLKLDIASFFASIPHDPLFALIRRRVRLPEVAAWLELIVGSSGERGLPIGALTSQHLANLYLGPLDHELKDQRGCRRYLRYMDDALLFGPRDALVALREHTRRFLAERLGLSLNPRQTALCRTRDGVPFLGFRVFPGLVRVQALRWRRFRLRLRRVERALSLGELTEDRAAAKMSSAFSHLAGCDTLQLRRRLLTPQPGGAKGAARHGLQPGQPWRLLEEQPCQRPRSEPRQEHPLQPRQQPGFPPRERGATLPEGEGLRILTPCHSADPGLVLRRGFTAESTLPGGDPRVAAGLRRGR